MRMNSCPKCNSDLPPVCSSWDGVAEVKCAVIVPCGFTYVHKYEIGADRLEALMEAKKEWNLLEPRENK